MKNMITSIKRRLAMLLLVIIAVSSVLSIDTFAINADTDYAPIFDATYYADNNEDLKAAFGYNEALLFEHFMKVGMDEGRQASEEFNVQSYRARYYDLRKVYGDKLRLYYFHYLYIGKDEGRNGTYFEVYYNRTFKTKTDAYEKAKKTITKEDVQNYYDSAVFVGDSIMTGFCFYAGSVSESSVAASDFLAQKSFSLYHALRPVEEDDHQVVYQGVKRNVWDHIPLLDVDKVFLMFGTNDLVSYNVFQIVDRYDQLIANIREVNPDVEIYVISMTSTYPGVNKGYLNNMCICNLNTLLEMLAPCKNYKFVDLNSYVSDSKYDQKTEYSSDNYVHHNMTSYKTAWEDAFYDFAVDDIANMLTEEK